MSANSDYLRATRHPWPCFLFLLPLLLVYELGVYQLGGMHPDSLRNGADHWMRIGLSTVGLRQHFWAPAILLAVLAIWNLRRQEPRPGDLLGVLSGMSIESVAFALGLWAISRGLGPLIDHFGLELQLAGTTAPMHPALGQMVTFLGAGIYEELLFRLFLFSGLLVLGRRLRLSGAMALIVATALSALIFSAAHHVGPYGEPFEGYTFLFRTVAGVYFALLYHARGFGVAVGAHACYDLIVGIVIT